MASFHVLSNGVKASKRGIGIQFGPDVAKKFLKANSLDLLIRSHECVLHGVEWPFGPEGGVVTVFSCSNYGGGGRNYGGVLKIDRELKTETKTYIIYALQMEMEEYRPDEDDEGTSKNVVKAKAETKSSNLLELIVKNRTPLLAAFNEIDKVLLFVRFAFSVFVVFLLFPIRFSVLLFRLFVFFFVFFLFLRFFVASFSSFLRFVICLFRHLFVSSFRRLDVWTFLRFHVSSFVRLFVSFFRASFRFVSSFLLFMF
jgi:hypothetical protein